MWKKNNLRKDYWTAHLLMRVAIIFISSLMNVDLCKCFSKICILRQDKKKIKYKILSVCFDLLSPSRLGSVYLHYTLTRAPQRQEYLLDHRDKFSFSLLTLAMLLLYFFFIHFYYFFSFIFISWRLITLQYCSGFCHTLTWISHGFTCIPHPDPPSHLPFHPIPLGLPSAPGPSTWLMHPTWAGDLFHPR